MEYRVIGGQKENKGYMELEEAFYFSLSLHSFAQRSAFFVRAGGSGFFVECGEGTFAVIQPAVP